MTKNTNNNSGDVLSKINNKIMITEEDELLAAEIYPSKNPNLSESSMTAMLRKAFILGRKSKEQEDIFTRHEVKEVIEGVLQFLLVASKGGPEQEKSPLDWFNEKYPEK